MIYAIAREGVVMTWKSIGTVPAQIDIVGYWKDLHGSEGCDLIRFDGVRIEDSEGFYARYGPYVKWTEKPEIL